MRNWITGMLAVMLTLISLVLIWQLADAVLDIPSYTLPSPLEIFDRMLTDWDVLLKHSRYTLIEVAAGFAMSVVVGIPIAIMIVYFRYFSRAFFPLFIGMNCVPIVSFAPLLVVWFGYGMLTKVLIAFMISVFPIIINTVIGLRSIEKEMLSLARSLRANSLQAFLYFRLPKSLPYIFGGLKIGITLAVVGSVVSEFVASNRGLGYLQLTANARLDTTLVFCVIVTLAIIGVGLYNLVALVERIAIPWYRSSREEG